MAAIAAGMEKEKVIRYLLYYPEISEDIKTYRHILGELELVYNTIPAMNYDGMPHGKNNISRITEDTAMNIPDDVRADIKFYNEIIEELQKLKTEILKEVSRLPLQQKNVIFSFYFYGMKWEQVAERTHYCERQCKNVRDRAVESLSKRFANNRYIAAYVLPERT